MRKVYREGKKNRSNKKGGIILKGIKFLVVATVLMFAVVFIVSRFSEKPEPIESITPVEDGTQSEQDNAVIPAGPNLDDGDDYMNNVDTDDNIDVDNKWAMFLVNENNPLPDNYDQMIKTSLIFQDYRDYFMDSRMADYMLNMIAAAADDGVDLYIVSAYRDMDYQKRVFDSSLQERLDSGMNYEAAYADTALNVAIPGRSEHNAGLAADIMSRDYTDMSDDGFKNTPEFAWLQENAADFGFILRYPEDKTEITGITYEPWHYRFIGVYYANELKRLDMCLEEYYEYRGWLDENKTAVYMTVN